MGRTTRLQRWIGQSVGTAGSLRNCRVEHDRRRVTAATIEALADRLPPAVVDDERTGT